MASPPWAFRVTTPCARTNNHHRHLDHDRLARGFLTGAPRARHLQQARCDDGGQTTLPVLGRSAARASGSCAQALPSLADRVRLGAVCREWRRIARQEPDLPPPLPWLTLLDGTFLGYQSGEVHRMHVPEEDYASLHGSVGDWLFLKRPDGKLELMNPFSKCVVRLPIEANGRLRDSIFHKLMVPLSSTLDDLSLEDSLFAVLTVTRRFQSVISIGRRHVLAPAALKIMPDYIYDASFFQGKLYALALEKIFAFEIVSSDDGRLSVSSMKHVANAVEDRGTMCQTIGDKTYNCIYRSYLVATSGKLLHVRRLIGVLSTLPKDERFEAKNYVTLSFEVYEVDLTTNSKHKWKRLNTLQNQALFVGTRSSKVLIACECGAQENCIYFVCDYDHEHWTTDPLRDCGVFNMRNKMITPLLLDITVVRPQGCKGLPAWFFPTKTM